MKSKKVTKKQLKDAIICEKERCRKLVDLHWPSDRHKLSVLEIITEARKLSISITNQAWIA